MPYAHQRLQRIVCAAALRQLLTRHRSPCATEVVHNDRTVSSSIDARDETSIAARIYASFESWVRMAVVRRHLKPIQIRSVPPVKPWISQ